MTGWMHPVSPTSAYRAFYPAAAAASTAQRTWTPADGPMPALYLGHGAPPLLDDEVWMDQLSRWGAAQPKPTAVLMVSAHWESAPLAVSATAPGTPLVYDFGGFAPEYYQLTYPTPDSGQLADAVQALLPDGQDLHRHASRGLDHGAWVPMMVMYPLGDVPVLQLSLPTHAPDQLLAIGARLAALREQGVLVIGSGFLTHGLPFLTRETMLTGAVPTWSAEFDAWAAEAIARRDVDALADYPSAPGMPYAHPTAEHFSPLFVTLGASDLAQPIHTPVDGFAIGLSKRSLQLA